jgi:hypothetical protein
VDDKYCIHCSRKCDGYDLDAFLAKSNIERERCLNCLRDENEKLSDLAVGDYFIFEPGGLSLMRAINFVGN